MSDLAYRVARRFIQANLNQELVQRMHQTFTKYDDHVATDTANWFQQTFHFDTSKTPPGQKKLKNLVSAFHWFLRNAGIHALSIGGQSKEIPGEESAWREAKRIWEQELQPLSSDLVKYFSDEGIKVVPKELQIGQVTYMNLVGFDEKALAKLAQALEAVFDKVQGWRRKALSGLKVALAGPKYFHDTAGGKYKADEDTLYVRATPAVLKRTRGTYGAFDYILIHELGHRYDHKVGAKVDFDRQEWQTTPYSRNDGETFAELFALSNFGIKGTWGNTLDKFEALMP